MRIATPVVYVCDFCWVRVNGYMGELPKGWSEVILELDEEFIGHRCDACSEKVLAVSPNAIHNSPA